MNVERDKARLWMLAGGAASIVILALGWLLVASPALAQIDSVRSQIADVVLQNSKVTARNAVLVKAEADRERHEAEYRAALAQIPQLPETAEFGDLLESYANEQNLSLTRSSTGNPVEIEGVEGRTGYRIPVSFTLRGNIDRVQSFLDQLQRTNARAMIISSFETQPLEGPQDGNLEGDVVATISGGIWVTPDA